MHLYIPFDNMAILFHRQVNNLHAKGIKVNAHTLANSQFQLLIIL